MFHQGVIHEAYRDEVLPANRTDATGPSNRYQYLRNKTTNSNPLCAPVKKVLGWPGQWTTLSRKATTPPQPPTSLVHQHENWWMYDGLSSPCKVALRSRSRLESRFKLRLGNIHIHTPAHIYPRCLPHFFPRVFLELSPSSSCVVCSVPHRKRRCITRIYTWLPHACVAQFLFIHHPWLNPVHGIHRAVSR